VGEEIRVPLQRRKRSENRNDRRNSEIFGKEVDVANDKELGGYKSPAGILRSKKTN